VLTLGVSIFARRGVQGGKCGNLQVISEGGRS